MILQGFGHQISCIGVCDANDPPQKRAYTTPAATLDLRTSLRGDSALHAQCVNGIPLGGGGWGAEGSQGGKEGGVWGQVSMHISSTMHDSGCPSLVTPGGVFSWGLQCVCLIIGVIKQQCRVAPGPIHCCLSVLFLFASARSVFCGFFHIELYVVVQEFNMLHSP